MTNEDDLPPVECIFNSLSGLWIGCFSYHWKIVGILKSYFLQTSFCLCTNNNISVKIMGLSGVYFRE